MSAPESVLRLVERFDRNHKSYHSAEYNETQVRREFVDPFFKALAWDIDNERGYAESYKDVVHEYYLRIPSATSKPQSSLFRDLEDDPDFYQAMLRSQGGNLRKAPDYAFRVGGKLKFFVEAKKPIVHIKQDELPAYQIRRYAWSAKLPLSILTDFEEFAVYDCRIKPEKMDKASVARTLYYTYQDYAEKWDEIKEIFHHEQLMRGSFDKYAEATKSKRGTAEVDEAFLKEIETWRASLARSIAFQNSSISQRDLNFAVQIIIDRIVFLRICEDRGIEPYGRLREVTDSGDAYAGLLQLFYQADDRYNSGLFHFERARDSKDGADGLTPYLAVDNKTLRSIVKNLYYPNCPYEFSVLPADILGQVYEQFLGKVIQLDSEHHATVDEKPEVKKAGGVYYTPTFVVDSIVKETVGGLLKYREPQKAADSLAHKPFRVLDPACGSGSFLIGAYQFLLDWYREQYLSDGTHKWSKGKVPRLYQGTDGSWQLTVDERKRILLAHIYGVDIDPQAVEVTKLSLLLKVLEGENEQTLNAQPVLFQKRVLPDLGNNIKCGNSLIDSTFYKNHQIGVFTEDERFRINIFDWKEEFPNVFGDGGFDAIIGNPPYIRIQTLKEFVPVEVDYYKKRYITAQKGNYDIYVIFVEKALDLLNEEGRLGYILPHKFFNAKYGEPLRNILAGGRNLSRVVHFGDHQIFKKATTYTCLLFAEKSSNDLFEFVKVASLDAWKLGRSQPEATVSSNKATAKEWNFVVGKGTNLFERLTEMPIKLGEVADIFVGLQTSADTVFLFKSFEKTADGVYLVESKELNQKVQLEESLLRPVIRSGKIGRFWATPTAQVLFPYKINGSKHVLISEEEMVEMYPLAWEYLNLNHDILSCREHGKFKKTGWYQLYPKNLDVWEAPKIMLPYMITRLAAYFDESSNYFVNVTTGGFGVKMRQGLGAPQYFVGLLNSRLLDWYIRIVSTNFNSGYYAANKQFLVQLPMRLINFSDRSDVARHKTMNDLVDTAQQLHRRLNVLKTAQDKKMVLRQIDSVDKQVQHLVYELYELTDSEIEIVEKEESNQGD